ncbi:hypothetical protein [Nostoc sp.]|uniref:hypothetical protein n=1 Tax=Nostoc sp. TaxID=1180 RepID=UPI002FF7EB58
MTKESLDKFVLVPKDVFVLNTLAMGVAIQFLAKLTGEEIKAWKEYVSGIASKQYRELSSREIQEIVDSIKDLKPPDES